MDVHAVARLGRVQQRREAGTHPPPAGDLAHDLPEDDAPVCAREPLGRLHGDLELVRCILREEPLGLDPRLGERAHDLPRERLGTPLCLERERQRRRRVKHELELVLEACHHVDVELVLDLLQRVAQEAPWTALPGLPVGIHDVAEQELERRLAGVCGDPHAGAGVGQQAQVARRAERVWLGHGAERSEGVVGRHPADAGVEPLEL
jgi:hypothetical protein